MEIDWSDLYGWEIPLGINGLILFIGNILFSNLIQIETIGWLMLFWYVSNMRKDAYIVKLTFWHETLPYFV